MKNLPKISIVIPSLNKAEFIGKTLQSIIDQGYPNLEVIIRDGGSRDGTVEIIKNFVGKYPEIFFWEKVENESQLEAISRGLEKSSGDILTFINTDDVYKKGALLAVGGYFAKHPNTLWVAGKGETVDERGARIAPIVDNYKNYLLTVNNYSLLLVVNYLIQPSVFLGRTVYEKYGPFTGTSTSVMEYELWLKISRIRMPTIINRCLSSFRISKGSISTSSFKITLKKDEEIVGRYTANPLILTLHYLHNIARAVIVNFLL